MKTIRFYGWLIYNMPFFEITIDLFCPFLLTAILTPFIYRLIEHFVHHTPYNTPYIIAAEGIVIFMIVLCLQHRLIEKMFGKPLREFISCLKGKHPVTKKFAIHLLRKFISGKFKANDFDGVLNLSELISKIQTQGSFKLSDELYALLLREAANMRPDRMWSTWDASIFTEAKVFDMLGGIVPDYEPYFSTLDLIYSNIKKVDDKSRILIFTDEAAKTNFMKHPGWATLKKKHTEWNCQLYSCLDNAFLAAHNCYNNVYMKDFVVYENKFLRNRWVIGIDMVTKMQSLIPSSIFTDDSRKLYDDLKGRADREV